MDARAKPVQLGVGRGGGGHCQRGEPCMSPGGAAVDEVRLAIRTATEFESCNSRLIREGLESMRVEKMVSVSTPVLEHGGSVPQVGQT